MRAFAALVCAAVLLGGAARATEAKSYQIAIQYDPASQTVQAMATIVLKPEPQARTVRFYLHNELTVSVVTAGGKQLAVHQESTSYDYSYTLKANRVDVEIAGADMSAGLRIAYAGRFSPSAARSPSDYMRGDAEGLFLRAYGYSLWFPTFAEPGQEPGAADFSVQISAPADFRAVFVGRWLARQVKHGIATESWQAKNISLFDAQLTIRRFQVERSGPVVLYRLGDADSVAATQRIAQLSRRLLAYYRSHYRTAAADRPIYVVEEPEFGDISSGNVIGVQDKRWRAITPESPEAETLAHELVHAFVQTATPRNDPLYAFAIEGFPSYFHLPAMVALLGETYYQKKMDRVQNAYLARRASGKDSRGNSLPPEKAILSMTPDDVGRYKDLFVLNDRALLFWDYLRRNMQTQSFDALVRDLTTRPQVRLVDFYGVLRAHAAPLEPDAHRWLETTEYPESFRRP